MTILGRVSASLHFDATDLAFATLRFLALTVGTGWVIFTPLPPETRGGLALLMGAFLLYSLALYAVLWRRPAAKRKAYLATLLFDLLFIYFLIVLSGDRKTENPFHLAFYLLTALHSFYFGLRTGLVVAVASSVLCLLSGACGDLRVVYWTDIAIRISFLLASAIFLGLLSEMQNREQEAIRRMSQQLKEQNLSLEEACRRLQEAQDRLIQSEKLAAVGTFISGIAHEINGPAGIILARIELIQMDAAEMKLPQALQDDLNVLQKNVQRMADIARHLLSFTRQANIELSRMDPNKLIQDVLLLFERPLHREKIVVKSELAPDLPQLLGNPGQIQQVLVNIITNARDAMPEGGTITLTTRGLEREGGPWVRIAIANTGKPIPPEHMSKIFDPFFTTKPKGKGTGLGLAVSYNIVREHGGTIDVESGPGAGTVFTITLPVAHSLLTSAAS